MAKENALSVRVHSIKHGGGPRMFLDRIKRPLKKRGISLTTIGPFAVELAFITRKNKGGWPCVLRVDGCYYQESDRSKNKAIKTSIERSDHIIFQSSFSKQMCEKILKPKGKRPTSIIHNGFPRVKVDHIEPAKGIDPSSFVICSTNEVKRVESSVKGFLEADTGRDLYVIGDANRFKKLGKHSSIHLLGKKNNQQTLSIMKACSYQMHLSYIDSCPNAVVEGLSLGLNVLCTNLGGTKELVQDNGIVLEADEDFDFQIRRGTPRNIDAKFIASGIHDLIKITHRADRPDLDIVHAADKYAEIIKGLANGT